MAKLILMRHGESEWNRKNLFTGWVDIPLSKKGIEESLIGGEKIRDIPIDVIYVSSLIRSQMTAFIAMLGHSSNKIPVLLHPGEGNLEKWAKIYSDKSKSETIPVYEAWELNERMYGALQGMNKDEMRAQYGEEQVRIWRRSFDVAPPEGESLKVTAERAIPYFEKKIVPNLKKGKNVFVSAHGNSLRAIVMRMKGLSKEEVLKLELQTGEPLIYDVES